GGGRDRRAVGAGGAAAAGADGARAARHGGDPARGGGPRALLRRPPLLRGAEPAAILVGAGGRGARGGAGDGAAGRARELPRAPVVSVSRAPARFALLVTLCLAATAGLGIAALGRRLARRRPRARAALFALLVAGLLAEHVAAPYPTVPVETPAFYRQLGASAEEGTVFELFVGDRSRSLFDQTIHRRPIAGGYLSRPLAYPLRELPPFDDPFAPGQGGDIVAAPGPEVGLRALAFARVRWIVVYLDQRLDLVG